MPPLLRVLFGLLLAVSALALLYANFVTGGLMGAIGPIPTMVLAGGLAGASWLYVSAVFPNWRS
jgi:hypothetical protein